MRNGDVPTPFWLSSRDVTRELLPEALLRARHHRALTQVRVEQRRAQLTVGDDPRLLTPERRHELAAARGERQRLTLLESDAVKVRLEALQRRRPGAQRGSQPLGQRVPDLGAVDIPGEHQAHGLLHGVGAVDGVEEALVLGHVLHAFADVPVSDDGSGGRGVHVEAARVHLDAYARDALDPDAHAGQGRALSALDAVLACSWWW